VTTFYTRNSGARSAGQQRSQEDGYDLIRRVRVTSSIPALALTAFAGPEVRARVLASGFQMHLSKPVRLGGLLDAISHRRQAGSELHS
jgi:CheY-like chemotaxis protein